MSIRYYIAPIITTPMPQAINASRVHLHMNFTGGDGYSSVMPNPYKSWSVAAVSASANTHTAIQADTQIKLVPFWGASGYLPLTATVSEVVEPYRTQISSLLTANLIPIDGITGSTPLTLVVRRAVRIASLARLLKANYPEYALGTTVGDIPAAQRQRISDWMVFNGVSVSGITGGTTIREVLIRILDEYNWPPMGFGSERWP